ncbi:TPA: hypothetical protein RRS91_005279 [Klebsiella pneumoniae]|nr:hypothetical protein [Klebsiella pneumoniae]
MSNKIEKIEKEISELSTKLVSLYVEKEMLEGDILISMNLVIDYFIHDNNIKVSADSRTMRIPGNDK